MKKQKQLTYSDYINLRYEEWKRNKPSEEEVIAQNVAAYKRDIKYQLEHETLESRKERLEALLDMNCQTKEDLNVLEYLYNDGNLRTTAEFEDVFNYRYAEKQNYHLDYDEECKKRNIIAALFPPLIIFFVLMFGTSLHENILGLVICLLAALVVALISMTAGHAMNVNDAKDYGISADNPRVIHERNQRDIGIASTIIATHSIYKNTKKAVKDIFNVDSWKNKTVKSEKSRWFIWV